MMPAWLVVMGVGTNILSRLCLRRVGIVGSPARVTRRVRTQGSCSRGSGVTGAWFGLVSYWLESDGVLVQQWLPAELLTKVGA